MIHEVIFLSERIYYLSHILIQKQFEDWKNETNLLLLKDINLKSFKTNKETNNYFITSIKEYHSNFTTRFGIIIKFERSVKGIGGILLNYHLMCSMLVLTSSINFLIDPKIVPGRAGVLVTLFLVMTSFFSDAQVFNVFIHQLYN